MIRSHANKNAEAPGDRACDWRSGFSLLEVVVATLIVGLLMLAALESLGAITRGQGYVAQRSRGWLLAQDMMAEVLDRGYQEPDDAPLFGREGSESSANRGDYDDTDDYHGWVASPPQSKDGAVMSNLTDWERRVTVERVSTADLVTGVASEEGLRRVTVDVRYNGVSVVKLVTLRAKAWKEPPFD
ncbi:MAG: prepilin-type N-terminal cleavage/methylation domain-containing protein [Pirellulaceae bacterium]